MKLKFSSFLRLRNTLLLTGIFLLSLVIYGAMFHVSAASQDRARDGRLVTFHDRGEIRVILTHARTVADALRDAQINVVDEDMVEPALDEPLVATDYTVNIYRARPVVVVDGYLRQKIMTAAQTPKAIAAAAGITLRDEDKMELNQNPDIVNDGASVVLTISRAIPFTLNLYGTISQVYSHERTIREMLVQKRITLGPQDTLSVSRDAMLQPGMTVAIWRDGVQTTTVEESISFSVRQIQDVDQPVGYRKVQTTGTNGKKLVTYQITMKGGSEVQRATIQSVILEQPKEQVEIVGVALPPGSHQDWLSAAGMPTSDHGYIDFIFTRESRWNPAARNPSGLYVGLGQTSPSKLSAACPNWQGDPVCQIKFFDRYAKSRYGSWLDSYNFWKSHNWW